MSVLMCLYKNFPSFGSFNLHGKFVMLRQRQREFVCASSCVLLLVLCCLQIRFFFLLILFLFKFSLQIPVQVAVHERPFAINSNAIAHTSAQAHKRIHSNIKAHCKLWDAHKRSECAWQKESTTTRSCCCCC